MKKRSMKHLQDLRFQYLNELINISKVQAEVLRIIHVEKQPHGTAAAQLNMSLDRVRIEEAAAFRNLFFIAIGDSEHYFFSGGEPSQAAASKTERIEQPTAKEAPTELA